MSGRGETVAARARSLVGSRFRPQGRDPATGLDCVGAAAAAAGIAPDRLRRDYSLRGEHRAAVEEGLRGLGCARVDDGVQPGDVLVCIAGPAQLHIAVATEAGFVHADAGLRLVVERPWPVPWPIAGVWRLQGED